MAKVGRPSKVTQEEKIELLVAFRAYVRDEDDPTVVGFCAYDATAIKYEILRDNLNDWPEFSTLIKRAIQKQEAYLQSNRSKNDLEAPIRIFRLKQPQHGFVDRVDTDITTGGEKINVNSSQAAQLIRARAERTDP